MEKKEVIRFNRGGSRRVAIGLLACLVVVGWRDGTARADAFPLDEAIRILLNNVARKNKSAGVVLGLLVPDGSRRVLTVGGVGPNARPLDDRTVFEIGSVTKVFTGILLADMAQRGEMSLVDVVSTHLPPTCQVPSKNGKSITLLDLATHHAGFPSMPKNLHPADKTNPMADYTVKQIYEFLASYKLSRDPGEKYQYSNFGMGLLGYVLECKTGKTYEDLLVERVLKPLGLRDTRITYTSEMKARMTPGYDRWGSPASRCDFLTLGGSGAISSTVHDLLAFAQSNLEAADTPLGIAMREARAPRRDGSGKDKQGLGWHTRQTPSCTITWHSGNTMGFQCFLGIDQDGSRAVALLANFVSGEIDKLGFHLLDPASPLKSHQKKPGPTR